MSTEILRLRPYQEQAIESVRRAWIEGVRRPAVVLPTGAGKTVIFAHLGVLMHEVLHGKKTLVLVHTNELVDQAVNKFRDVAPHLRIGVVKAERNEHVDSDIIVATVQTLRSESRRSQLRDIGVVVVDECFSAGTLVGTRSIESLQSGDMVPSYDEQTGDVVQRAVVRTMRRQPQSLVRIRLAGGRSIVCTPSHPLMTTDGWCPAGALQYDAYVLSFTHDTTAAGDVHGVQPASHPDDQGTHRLLPPFGPDVLFPGVSRPVGISEQLRADGQNEPEVRQSAHDGTQSHAQSRIGRENEGYPGSNRPQAPVTGWERQAPSGATDQAGHLTGMAYGSNRGPQRWSATIPLQAGHGTPDNDSVCGSGWGIPLLQSPPRIGQAPGRTAVFTRVDDIQVLQPGSDGTYGGLCPDGFVYNLEVEGTHTYLVDDGVVAHNCHHATATTYRTILDHFGCTGETEDPALCVGFTATLARNDSASLGDIWQRVVYRKDILDLIEMSHLLPVRGKRIKVPDLDFTKVRKVHGDYAADDLGDALTDSLAPGLVAKAYLEHASDRSGIVFTPTVDTAYLFRDALQEAGITAETVHGALPREERQLILKRLKTGDVQVVTNCMVLTEGFDEPKVSCGVIARPTTSAALYTQMVGRILRPYPGQSEALLLDVVGVTGRHRLASLVDLVGDKTKILHEKDPESLADLLLTADGLELEEPGGGGSRSSIQFEEGDTYETREVDLFRKSHSAWLRTAGGTWFLPAGKQSVFLAPAGGAGTWNVAVIGPSIREFRYRRISLDAAMSWGEEVVRELGGNALVNKKGAWRRSTQSPSDAQVRMAQKLRIPFDDLTSKAELSDLISARLASRDIDPIVKQWIREA